MKKWFTEPFGFPMTVRRWVLVAQIIFACLFLFMVLRTALGFHVPPPTTKFDMATLSMWAAGICIWTIVAPVGILTKKAWGYFMEIPVIALSGLIFYLLPERSRVEPPIPWMPYLTLVGYVVFTISEMWKCGRIGFFLLRSKPRAALS